jgi:hypothetical protein
LEFNFIGGENWSTQRKQQSWYQSLTNFIIQLYRVEFAMSVNQIHNFSGDHLSC